MSRATVGTPAQRLSYWESGSPMVHVMMFPIIEYTEFVPVLIIPKKTMELTRFPLSIRTIFGVEMADEEVKYVPKCYWGEVFEMKASMPAQGLSSWGVESAEYFI